MAYFILLIKILIFCIFAIATRGTLPRYRFDQLTQLSWKYFIFFWFLFLMINILFIYIF